MTDHLEIHGEEEWGHSSISSIIKNTPNWEDFMKEMKARLISLSHTWDALALSDEVMELSDEITRRFWAIIS